MRFISGNYADETGKFLGQWWEENTGNLLRWPFSAIGVLRNDDLVGVAIFVDYTGSNVEAHVFAPNCLTKSSLRYFFNYVFNVLECNILRVKPFITNRKALEIINNLGFTYEYTLEQYYGPSKAEDAIMFKIKKDQVSKWVN